MNKFLEGCEKLPDGRYRLHETISVSKDNIVAKEVLKEKVVESINGVDLPVWNTYLIKLWSKNNFNKNGRSYVKVFNKVLEENKVTIGFIDHPDDGSESYKDVILVGKNPVMKMDENGEEWLCVYVTLVGKPFGENCEAVLEAGGFIEFSSSALGDVDNDGYVLLDGFFLERYADIVVNSSNAQLFFKNKEEPRDISPRAKTTLYDDKEEVVNEKVTILKTDDNKLKENTMPDKISEKALELNIKSLIREAEGKTNLVEKKQTLESLLEFSKELSTTTQTDEIMKKITETDNTIHALAEKGSTVDSLNENIVGLTESKSLLEKEIEDLKEAKSKLEENYNAIVELYESKQYESSQEEILINKKLNSIIDTLKEKQISLSTINTKLKERVKFYEAQANSKVDAELVVTLNEKIKELSAENEELSSKVAVLNEMIRNSRRVPRREEREVRTPSRIERRVEAIQNKRTSNFLNEEVEIYYNTLIEDDDSMESLKEKFMGCNTLVEAQKIRMNMDSHTTSSEVDVAKMLSSRGLE